MEIYAVNEKTDEIIGYIVYMALNKERTAKYNVYLHNKLIAKFSLFENAYLYLLHSIEEENIKHHNTFDFILYSNYPDTFLKCSVKYVVNEYKVFHEK